MTDRDVTIVIVTHDSADVIAGALRSIPDGYRVICVDNESQDGTREIVARNSVHLIASTNVGFGRACNLGARAADTEFLLFLNPDVRIAADTIERLTDAAGRYPDVDILFPGIADADGKVLFRDTNRIDRWRQPRRSPLPVHPIGDCCTGFVEGSVFLVRREFFLGFGGFDPNIFLYYEDDDLSYRLQLSRCPMVYVHAARATHTVSTSSPATTPILMRRARARKISEYYLKAKYGKRAYPILDMLRQLAAIAWYGVTLDSRRRVAATGRLTGIAYWLASPRDLRASKAHWSAAPRPNGDITS